MGFPSRWRCCRGLFGRFAFSFRSLSARHFACSNAVLYSFVSICPISKALPIPPLSDRALRRFAFSVASPLVPTFSFGLQSISSHHACSSPFSVSSASVHIHARDNSLYINGPTRPLPPPRSHYTPRPLESHFSGFRLASLAGVKAAAHKGRRRLAGGRYSSLRSNSENRARTFEKCRRSEEGHATNRRA